MMSARPALSPGTSSRSAGVSAASCSRMCSTSCRGMAVPCTLRTRMPCRARNIPARLVNVPPEPITVAPRQSRTGSAFRMDWRTCLRNFLRPFTPFRSERNRSVIRIAPNGNESRRSTRPSAANASSSDPPPISITTLRPTPSSKCASADRNARRASSSPSRMRGRSPASRRRRARNAWPLLASRTALVATASMRLAPSCRASVAIRVRASTAASVLASSSLPLTPSPAPRRGAAFISSTTRMVPSGETSATICRIELDPMSMAAMRCSRSSLLGRYGPSLRGPVTSSVSRGSGPGAGRRGGDAARRARDPAAPRSRDSRPTEHRRAAPSARRR